MAVFEAGSAASGLDLKQLCFEATAEQLVETEVQQPALVATSLALNAALRARGIKPDFVVGHSVGEFAALAAAELDHACGQAIALVRERGLAMAAAARSSPGSMAAILGLKDEVVETLCRKIVDVWPANYNCPGQIVDLGRGRRGRRVLRGGRARRREARDQAPRLGRVPLAARRARGGPAAAGDREGGLPGPKAAFMSTVTAKLEEAQRYRTLLVEQLTAPVKFTQAARALIGNGVTVVRRGRAGQRAQRFTEEDRQIA